MSGPENLRTLSGETQRIATDALAQGTLSKEDLLAAVVLLKVQRNDARVEAARLRALLESILDAATDGRDCPEWLTEHLADIRAGRPR